MWMTRWANSEISGSWVTSTMVLPWAQSLSINPMISTEVVESRLPVGSSASRMLGLLIRARAMAAAQLVGAVVAAVIKVHLAQGFNGALLALVGGDAGVDQRQLDVVLRG